jgi:5-formyltetrahydrofolate cyclo-ligase
MITEKDIARINELYHKQKGEGLNDAEKAEQAKLRRAYIDAIKGNIRTQLNNIDIVDENGKVENLGEKYGSKSN